MKSVVPQRLQDEVDRQLSALLGPGGVSRAGPDLLLHAADALRPSRFFPGSAALKPNPRWVVWPQTVEQVQGLVRLANESGIPLVPYGGGTGLMGGALSATGGIVVDMTRMNRVHSVDARGRMATAEAGTVLQDLDQALNPHGLMLGHDPWTVSVATVGGAISTNSLGYRGAQYGSMGEQVLGIEVVLPDASLITTRAVPKRSTGPALHQLFIGTEGCFGIITAATIKAFPIPEARRLYAFRFAGFEPGFDAVQQMFSVGLVPALMEYGEDYPSDTPEGWGRRPPKPGAELFLAFEGPAGVVAAQSRRALAICAGHRGEKLPAREATEFWAGRHHSAIRFQQDRLADGRAPFLRPREPGPLVDFIHVALPASRVLEYRAQAMELVDKNGLQVRDCGLWNRPELFSMVVVEPHGKPGWLAPVMDRLLLLAQDLDGSMEYCHGVGLRLAHLMQREHGAGLELLRTLKRALDPANIMNPGKLGL